MTTSRHHTTAPLLSAALLSLAMTGTATAATSLTFAHAHPVTDSQHLAAERFAERLAERSAGELTVKIFPNGQLGNDQAMISGVRSGTIDLELSGNPYFSGLVSELNVLDLPFLFDTREQAYQVLDGEVGQDLLTAMQPQQIPICQRSCHLNGLRGDQRALFHRT
ncbi:MAG: TRAP transporter substrate-binding protein DctP [Cobetia sp.]|jgi:TRAP-type C4-dicarboxylate transport system substrate-binding protein|uniref:TRAP transporter substrate-binding protein DctP n=3 Tax=Cobetia TaxID=204286 RepID=UPI000C50268A|nr:TRAP transporter substrate-binding protein DctP [Cobetia sp.]MBF09367.1 hypothetical protein [Cobetia sp.]